MPNVGSLVKVNFEQVGIKIAEDYAKVIIGQEQPIHDKILRLWAFIFCLCLSRFCFRWLVQERIQIYINCRRLYWNTLQSVFWQVPLRFRALHPQWCTRHPPFLFTVGRNAECRKPRGWRIRYGRRPADHIIGLLHWQVVQTIASVMARWNFEGWWEGGAYFCTLVDANEVAARHRFLAVAMRQTKKIFVDWKLKKTSDFLRLFLYMCVILAWVDDNILW